MKFSNKDFVHHHVHSTFSHFDGLANLNDLVMAARQMGFPALAVTDHGNIMSVIKFIKKCLATKDKKGKDIEYPIIKPIIGCEFYLSRQIDIGQNISNKKDKSAKSKKTQPDERKGNRHLNIYAMNYEGYKNLCILSQKSWRDGFYYDPRIDIELLSKHCKGLMIGSACLSSVININLLYDNYDKAKKICGMFKEMTNDNFFLEVMYHGIPEEKAIIPDIFKLSSELQIPVVASNDVHYIKKEQSLSQEILMCMSSSKCIKDEKHISFPYGEFYLKSAQEMAMMFRDNVNCIYNSVALAERIDTEDIEKNLFGGMRLPKFNIPEQYKTPYEYLEKLSWQGLKEVGWDDSQDHINALKKELEDVKVAKDNNNYDFATYFLIVRDYIKKANDMGALVGAGRGSGYASIMLRCLGITYGIDPLEYELIWERFLGFSNSAFIKESDFYS